MTNGDAEVNGSVRKKARHPKKTAPPAARCCKTAACRAIACKFRFKRTNQLLSCPSVGLQMTQVLASVRSTVQSP